MTKSVQINAYLRVTRKLLSVAKDVSYHERWLTRPDKSKSEAISHRISLAASMGKLESLAGALSGMHQAGLLSDCYWAARDQEVVNDVMEMCGREL